MFCLFYSLCWKIFALSCCLRNRIIHSITGTEHISTMHCSFFLHFILILQTLALGHIFTEPLLIHYLFYKMLMLNIHCPSKRWIQKFCPILSKMLRRNGMQHNTVELYWLPIWEVFPVCARENVPGGIYTHPQFWAFLGIYVMRDS